MTTEATASEQLEVREALKKYNSDKSGEETKNKVDKILKLEKKADLFSKWTVILVVLLSITVILIIYFIYIKPSLTGKWIDRFEREIKMKHNKLTDSVFIEEGEGPGDEGRGVVNKYGKVKKCSRFSNKASKAINGKKIFKIKKPGKKYGDEAIGLWNMKDTIIWHFPRSKYGEIWHREHQIN